MELDLAMILVKVEADPHQAGLVLSGAFGVTQPETRRTREKCDAAHMAEYSGRRLQRGIRRMYRSDGRRLLMPVMKWLGVTP